MIIIIIPQGEMSIPCEDYLVMSGVFFKIGYDPYEKGQPPLCCACTLTYDLYFRNTSPEYHVLLLPQANRVAKVTMFPAPALLVLDPCPGPCPDPGI